MTKVREIFYKIRIFRSLRARLFLIILFTGLAASLIMRRGILGSYESRALNIRIYDVQNQYNILANHLAASGYLRDTSLEIINTELDQISSLYDGRILIIDKSFNVLKDTYGISEGKTIISKEVIQCFSGVATTNYDDTNGFIELAIPITGLSSTGTGQNGNADDPTGGSVVEGVLLSSASTDSISNTLIALGRSANALEGIFMVFLLPLAFVLASTMTRPFTRISRAIEEIKAGFAEGKIEVMDYLETEHISDAFNQLQGRMKAMDDTRQEFVSNVSHELKTPLTSMKVLADSLIAQEDVPNELYREFMTDIGAEIDREAKIIDDLLSLVRMDKRASDLNISSTDLNAFTELILKRMRPIAGKAGVEIVYESRRNITADIDEVKLTLAISNLVENAIKYNNPGGSVHVILDADHQNFTLEVKDTGIGIPEDSLAHIYERFYRADKSHSRTIGGTGLGLAISRKAILMHRGTIDVESKEGEGTRFMVTIPLIYSAQQSKEHEDEFSE